MRWFISDRFDPRALPLADRHYNRRKVGSPQFVPPGRCLVLLTRDADALWVTSWPFAEYVRHAWPGAWVNSLFRNESAGVASDMIADALAATVDAFGAPPRVPTWIIVERTRTLTRVERSEVAMITFVDADAVRRKRDPGRCYLRAGFDRVGMSKGGLVALGLRTSRVPAPIAASPSDGQMALLGVAS